MNRSMTMTMVLGTAIQSKDNPAAQGMQIRLSEYQVRDNVPMLSLHGIVSRPLPGAHVAVMMQRDNPSTAIGIAVNDVRYYKAGLPDGTVGLAHHLGAHVLAFDDRIEVDGGGKPVVVKNASALRVEGNLDVTGEIKAMCDGQFVTLSQHLQNGQKPTPGT